MVVVSSSPAPVAIVYFRSWVKTLSKSGRVRVNFIFFCLLLLFCRCRYEGVGVGECKSEGVGAKAKASVLSVPSYMDYRCVVNNSCVVVEGEDAR